MFKPIENLLYKIRDLFWSYPDIIVGERDSLVNSFLRLYKRSRPLSHVISTSLFVLILITLTIGNASAFLRINEEEYIEGVITGVDEQGNLLSINRLNPLIPPVVQLERDLNEIIYEPLVNVNPDGTVTKVLLSSIDEIEVGQKYTFHLKENVKWHDGRDFDADDVIETNRLLLDLNSKSSTQSVFSRASQQMKVTKVDDYTVTYEVDGILPNFYEVISYKILPAHKIADVDANNIYSSRININSDPIGTGPFRFARSRPGSITLNAFPSYHEGEPKLDRIRFVYFADEDSAINGLKSGQIHGLAAYSTRVLEETESLKTVRQVTSSTLYNQYWGLYFNLRESAPSALRDVKVRQAIAYATDKTKVLEQIDGHGEVATGPIPETSFAYLKDKEAYEFNREKAEEILASAGWTGEIKKKGEEELRFTLTYVDNRDRQKIAEEIKADLGAVGIVIDLNPLSLIELNQDYILPRQFEILLYGVNTFVDPDRFELFHSAESVHPGLNIAGYESIQKTSKVIGGELTRIPAVDRLLEDGRSLSDKTTRKERYRDFQEIVANEVPIVFLYHPNFVYIVNQRVEGINLTDMTSVEDRFLSVVDWEINVQ